MPPPVVFDDAWEAKNIKSGPFRQHEGELRVYTISGLTPSCDTTSGKFAHHRYLDTPCVT